MPHVTRRFLAPSGGSALWHLRTMTCSWALYTRRPATLKSVRESAPTQRQPCTSPSLAAHTYAHTRRVLHYTYMHQGGVLPTGLPVHRESP